MKNIVEIVDSLEDSGLLKEARSEKIQNEAKEQIGGFINILLGTLGASLLSYILTDKGRNGAREGVIRAGYRIKKCQKATAK